MSALVAIVYVFSFLFVTTALFALAVGLLASWHVRPAMWWSAHPWLTYWIATGGMIPGAVLIGIGLETTGLIILLPALTVIYACLIWGLRTSWHQSKLRAVAIFAAISGAMLASTVSDWMQRGSGVGDLDRKVFGLLLAFIFWPLAAVVADRVYARFIARRQRLAPLSERPVLSPPASAPRSGARGGRLRDAMKDIGWTILGFAFLLAFGLVALLLIEGGMWLSEKLYPWLVGISGITLAITIFVLLPNAVFSAIPRFAGNGTAPNPTQGSPRKI